MSVRFAMFGDIVGKPGRQALRAALPGLRKDLRIDVVIANGENIAAGAGITPQLAQDLWDMGVLVVTTGDHVWDKAEIVPFFSKTERLLRPLNFPPGSPGQGYCVCQFAGTSFAVVNALGRVFLNPMDCPFRAMDALLSGPLKEVKTIFVDFHAEATSEKIAMGWHLDRRVTAIVGTHTHVPTADERILPGGTAYQTDLGMVGPRDGIIGVVREGFMQRFLTGRKGQRGVEGGEAVVNGALVDVDTATGRAKAISRIQRVVPEHEYARA